MYRTLEYIIVILFSVFLAVGSIGAEDGENSMSFIHVISFVFVLVSLLNPSNVKFIFKRPSYLLLPVAVLLLIFISDIFHAGHLQTGYYVRYLAAILCFCFFFACFVRDVRLLNTSILIFSLASSIIALLWIFNMMPGMFEIRNGRISVLGENINSTTAKTGLSILFILYFLLTHSIKNRVINLVLLFLLVPLFLFILASGTRGVFIAVIICVFGMLFFSNNLSRKVKIFIALPATVFVIFMGFIYISEKDEFAMVERLISSIESGGDESRRNLQKQAGEIIADNFITGIGESGYSEERMKRFSLNMPVHNVALHTFVTGGLGAFILLLLFYWKLIKPSILSIRKEPTPFFLLAYILLIAMKSGGATTYLLMWYIFGVCMALSYNILFLHKDVRQLNESI